jgi:acetyl-CoA synthetase
MASYQWNPSDDYIEQPNVTRLARTHGLAGVDELRTRTDLGLRRLMETN